MKDSFKPDPVYLLLIVAQTEWDEAELGNPGSSFYEFLAEGPPEQLNLAGCHPGTAMQFTLKHTNLVTVAARVLVGLVSTALTTRALLEALKPSLVAQVGFGGIISDDLRLGDVTIASQVDCYLTKNKAASSHSSKTGDITTEIVFAGEVYRPSHSLVHLAMNLKHAYPTVYTKFQEEVRQSLRTLNLIKPSHEARVYLRSVDMQPNGVDVSSVHVVHFASAEIVSTTAQAVKWLRSRDRKLAIIDMESGGLLAAVWEYSHRHGQAVDTLIIRGGGGYGDERHENIIKKYSKEIHKLAFENACRFLCRLLSVYSEPSIPADGSSSIDVGIIIPLEEEFSYFIDLLRDSSIGVPIRAEYREGRHYYLFERGGLTCAATFVGEMGLVRMALATEDLYQAFTPNLIVILGIAAGLSGPDGDVKICDVTVAKSVDLYFHRARNQMGAEDGRKHGHPGTIAELRKEETSIPTSSDLVDFITEDERFAPARLQWSEICARELAHSLEPFQGARSFDPDEFSIAKNPQILGVRLASGEFLAAASEFIDLLTARGCSAVDMEAGGAAIAYQRLSNEAVIPSPPKLLVLRGISDRGNEKKSAVEALGEPSMFRRACMRNASRLLLLLLENEYFVSCLSKR